MRLKIILVVGLLLVAAQAEAQTATRLRDLTTGTAGNITATSKLILDDALFTQAKGFTPAVFLDGAGLGPADSPAWQAITLTGSLTAGGVTISGLSDGFVKSTTGALSTTTSVVTSLAGTANQITASSSTGGITLSLPQDIATSSTPTFGGVTVNGLVASTGSNTITQATKTSGSQPVALRIIGGAHTGLGSRNPDVYFELSRIVTYTSGAHGNLYGVLVTSPTYAFSTTAGTITDAAAIQITGIPTAGTGATLENANGMYITGGAITASNSYALSCFSASGATNNYAARFIGGAVGIGTSTPEAMLQITRTTQQLRAGYNASNYMATTVGSTGSTTIDLVGTSPVFTLADAVTVQGALTATGAITFSGLSNGVVTSASGVLSGTTALTGLTGIASTGTITNTGPLIVTSTSSLGGAVTLTGNATITGTVNITGAIQADSVTNDTGLAHGTYTPTLTNVANLDGSTAAQCQYLRVGNTVTVSGSFAVDPTSAGTLVRLGISLPVASNFTNETNCGGVASAPGLTAAECPSAAALADDTNDRAEVKFVAGTHTTNRSMFFTFTYLVQ
jgi:hypothetical protein